MIKTSTWWFLTCGVLMLVFGASSQKSTRDVCTFKQLRLRDNRGTKIQCGDADDKTNLKMAPQVKVPQVKDGLFTLIMFDPDVPFLFKPGYVHWLVSGLTAAEIVTGDFSQNPTYPYMAPAPPIFSGKHNYIFYVFKQRGNMMVKPPVSRFFFDFDHWMQENAAVLRGPIASNCIKIGFNRYSGNKKSEYNCDSSEPEMRLW